MLMDNRINIFVGGHFSYEALRDNAEMLECLLSSVDLDVKISKEISAEKINLIYEGHHPDFWNEVFDIVSTNITGKKVLVCTEEVVGSALLPQNFYTFNHFEMISASKFRKMLRVFDLIFFNLRFYLTQSVRSALKKGKLNNKVGRIFAKFLSNFLIDNNSFAWKSRYNFFLSISKYCDGVISTYDQRYGFLGFKNFIYLPHLFTADYKPVQRPKTFKYHCIFTGQMTPHRQWIIDELRLRGVTVFTPGIVADSERNKLVSEACIVLGLLKESNQYTSSTNRTYWCLQNGFPIINEKPVVEDYLDEYVHIADTFHYADEIINKLNDLENFVSEFDSSRKRALSEWNVMKFESEIKKYLAKMIA